MKFGEAIKLDRKSGAPGFAVRGAETRQRVRLLVRKGA